MSMFDGILDNIDDVAAKLGLPADQVQAVVANLKSKVALKPGRRIIIAKFTEKNGAMAPFVEKS